MNEKEKGPTIPIDPELESHTIDKLVEQYNFGLSYELNDTGNGKRLVDKHKDSIRYHSSTFGTWWFIWNGVRWHRDSSDEMHQIAKSVVRDMYADIGKITDEAHQKKLLSHIQKSGNHKNLNSMIESAQNEPGIFMEIQDFDSHDDLLNVLNGMINLEDGSLIPPDKSKFITKLCPVNYNPEATCPTWNEFLKTSVPNSDVRAYLQRFFGYALTGHNRAEKLLIMLGKGENGKGVMLDTLTELFGDYYRSTDSSTIMEQRQDRSSSLDVADLYGYRFVRASETKEGKTLDEARVKTMTGGNTLKARKLYNDFLEYVAKFKLVLDTNYKPKVNSQGRAIWRRIDRVDFDVLFSDENGLRDDHLRSKLKLEWEGILLWLVDGAKEWYKRGLDTPKVILDLNNEYKAESDSIGGFLDACIDKDSESRIALKDIYTMYRHWCKYSDEETTLGKRKFGARLDEENKSYSANSITWRPGLKFKPELFKGLEDLGYFEGTDLSDQLVSCLFSTVQQVSYEREIVDSLLDTTHLPTESTSPCRPTAKSILNKTTEITPINPTIEKPVLSQQEVADILTTIRLEWEALDKPVHSSEYIPMFVTSLKVRCMARGYKLSQESAEEHVKRAYKVWGWATY